VLYWFRTPPGVKVGRAALDAEAIRRIEELNPGITFDWPRILKGQGIPPTESRPPFEARRQRPENRRPAPAPPPPPVPAGPVAPPPEPVESGTWPEPLDGDAAQVLDATPATPEEIEQIAAPPAALAKLGAEGIQRLRARYAEILVRITERTADLERREELKWQADRLNPDSWVTAEAVAEALEQYETVLASLGDVLGQRRRRKRRGSGTRPAESDGSGGERLASGELPTATEEPAPEVRDAGESPSAIRDEDPDDEDEPING